MSELLYFLKLSYLRQAITLVAGQTDCHHIPPGLTARLAVSHSGTDQGRSGQTMTRQLVEITLTRSGGQAWGFRILGGRDEGLLCTVEKVDNYNHY